MRKLLLTELLLLTVVCMLSGCAGGVYRPLNDGGGWATGFSESKLSEKQYRLKTVYAKGELAKMFWHQRAVELCGTQEYKHNIFIAKRLTNHVSSYGASPGLYVYEGLLNCP